VPRIGARSEVYLDGVRGTGDMRSSPSDSTGRLFVTVSAIVLLEALFYSVLAPLLPYYVHHLHISTSSAGLLTASYGIGALVSAIPAGLMVARVGARPTTFIGMLLLGATCAFFGLAESIVSLDVARFIQGASSSLIWAGGLAWLVVANPSERRGEVVGGVLGIAIGGTVLGPVIGSVAELTAPRATFSALAVVIIAVALSVLRRPGPPVSAPLRLGEIVHATLADPRMPAGMWFTAVSGTLFGVLAVLGPLRLSALGGGTLLVAGTFVIGSVMEGLAAPLMGRASDRRGPLSVIRVTLVVSALVALLLPVPDTAWLLATTIVLAILSFGAVWAPASSLLSLGAEAQGLDQGIAYAMWNFAWAAAQIVGGAGGAAVAAATSDAVPYVTVSVVCFSTAALLAILRPIAARRRLSGALAGRGQD
jgi:MFS family permease